MGAGKSKIGPVLASKFACPFHDLDKMIEQEAGKKISDIFQQEGEAHFRQLESQMIEQLALEEVKAVIALGGGALVLEINKSIAESSGMIVYLKSNPQAILERIKNSKKRPLLDIPRDEHFEDNLLKMIENLLGKRKEIYESAHLIFERDNYEYDRAAEMIYQKIIKL